MYCKKAKIHGLAATYGLGTHARDIWAEHPSVRGITEAAFARFGFLSLDGGKNVLVGRAIKEGVTAYNFALRGDAASNAAIHYCKAFFDQLATVLDYDVHVEGRKWQALTTNLSDMDGIDVVVSPAQQKWKHKELSPLKAVILSFVDELACDEIMKIKKLKASV